MEKTVATHEGEVSSLFVCCPLSSAGYCSLKSSDEWREGRKVSELLCMVVVIFYKNEKKSYLIKRWTQGLSLF